MAPTKKPAATSATTKGASRAAATPPARPARSKAAAPTATLTVVVDAPPPDGDDWSVPIPFTSWRLPLPSVPDDVTLPLVHWTITAPERESAAYYAVLGGLVAVEVIDWPIGVLLAAGHLLATQHRYRALAGVAEAIEVG